MYDIFLELELQSREVRTTEWPPAKRIISHPIYCNMSRMIRINPIPSWQLVPNLVVEKRGKRRMMMCEDGMGAEHMFSKRDGGKERRKRKCVGHFRCRSAMKGLSKEGRGGGGRLSALQMLARTTTIAQLLFQFNLSRELWQRLLDGIDRFCPISSVSEISDGSQNRFEQISQIKSVLLSSLRRKSTVPLSVSSSLFLPAATF